ncbi:antibiotic biosynthesis monooxygenase [Endozoicomonas sp. 8E]|uniref:antibiotic biosynthesis monooxygenase family protein n=1 Tax=Endozoicomonas sp. 8E TaxID=3035692 RepID=UPI0029391D35|nr:antibiotic biosynthesis monooxygenase [Endozoicomonas sp. 8E]WOG26516.1 antibiotic biosynthesis monooxygenase [Endozoicomonas sp. 8E]
MILEVAILDVKSGQEVGFERAFAQAQGIIASMKGYINHQLQKCLEKDSRYLLLVNWDTLEDHTEGFRGSEEYQEWKRLLHHFYDPFPEVDHYTNTLISSFPPE